MLCGQWTSASLVRRLVQLQQCRFHWNRYVITYNVKLLASLKFVLHISHDHCCCLSLFVPVAMRFSPTCRLRLLLLCAFVLFHGKWKSPGQSINVPTCDSVISFMVNDKHRSTDSNLYSLIVCIRLSYRCAVCHLTRSPIGIHFIVICDCENIRDKSI